MAPLLQQQQGLENQKAQFEKQQREAILGATQAAIRRGPNGEPQGVDYDKLENEATARGALPGSTNELQKQRQALAEQAQKLSDEQAAAHLKENSRVHQVVAGIGAAGPEGSPQREQAFQQAAMQEGKDHGMKAIADWPTKAPSDSDLAAWDTKLGMHGQALEDRKTQSEIDKNEKAATQAQLEARYLGIKQRQQLKQPVSPEDTAFANQYAKMKTDLSPSLNPIVLNYKAKADARADEKVNQHDADFIDKNYVKPANDKEQSYQMFQEAYDNRNNAKTGAESMLALSTHLATTFGNVKGARVTKDMIEHHLGARGVGDSALVAVQKLTNGDVLSPDQWDAFKSLITNARNLNWQTAKKEADRRGVDISGSLPADLTGSSNKPVQDFFSQYGGKKR